MHFTLVKLLPEAAAPSGCFDDIILPLYHAFLRLGYSAETRVNSITPHSVNILFGSCRAPSLEARHFPGNTIIFNLEQLWSPGCRWNNKQYHEHLRSFSVWEYSKRNVRYLSRVPGMKDVTHMPLGYVPEMTRLSQSFPQDVDVLFYGSINERRRKLLEQIQDAGLNLLILNKTYGTERDFAIARSKLVLNVHYYSPATLELPRLGYLWANSKCVISERAPETEAADELDTACAYRHYDDLMPAIMDFAGNKTMRETQAQQGFSAFSGLRQEDFLEAIVGRKSHRAAVVPLPARLNAGSGKDFRSDCLNIDINPGMNPDLALDISRPLDPTQEYETVRFGKIRLKPGSFEKITAFDVLEHVPDAIQTMTNFLDLLKLDGILEVSVPYDLSLRAWQDPTHKRAFNEMSWPYYCESAWYVGWRYTRFSIEAMSYVLSDYGNSLKNIGHSQEELLRAPRAVDGLRVQLRKRKSTDAELTEFARRTRAFYDGAVGDWFIERGR